MKEENRKKLISRYLENSASEGEVQVFFEEMKDDTFVTLLQSFEEKPLTTTIPKTARIKVKYWIAAACVLLAMGLGLYHLKSVDTSFGIDRPVAAFEQFLPAESKAVMKIDGQVVASLSDSSEYADKISILRLAKEVQYITVETQVANTFRMALPDGSLVYLNAETRLRFPKEFALDTRNVEVYGEAYFEVKTDADRPFIVSTHTDNLGDSRSMDVTVTGTKFLVSNYKDLSSAHTVLLEGSVSVNKSNIQPGYMYQLSQGRETISRPPSLSRYIDWIEGVFEFDGEPISSILYKIEKWYGVRFIGRKAFKNQSFGGVISRSVPLKDILNLLEENTDLRFQEAANNQITVL